MKHFFSIFFLTFILYYIIRSLIELVTRKKKASKFLINNFNEDRLYSILEVASSFNMEVDDFHRLLSILQSYKYFNFFNKKGVDMIKDYYSKYEIKFLVKILLKKNKLK